MVTLKRTAKKSHVTRDNTGRKMLDALVSWNHGQNRSNVRPIIRTTFQSNITRRNQYVFSTGTLMSDKVKKNSDYHHNFAQSVGLHCF